jgi:internalin A
MDVVANPYYLGFFMSARPTFKTIWLLFVASVLSACGDNSDADNIVPAPANITVDKPTAISSVSAKSSNNISLDQITFTDAKLASCVENTAKVNNWTNAHQVTNLSCANKGINSIGGIQHLTALQLLDLKLNQITALTPMAQLTALRELDLSGNGLVNIDPLASLTSLTHLNLGVTRLSNTKNNIRNISALANLTSLTSLDLANNQISDISALSNLDSLTRLQLSGNQIRDINVLFNIDYTAHVSLGDNNNITCAELNELETIVTEGRVARPDDCIFTLDILIADINFPDPKLKACVLDSASSEGWMTISEMTSLACDAQGLTELTGLQSLKALNYLDLRTNQAINISPLFELTATGEIDLSDNQQIACVKLDALEAILGTGVVTRGTSCSNVTLLSDLDFVDPVLEACVRYTADVYQWQKIDEMVSLHCDNNSEGKIQDLRGIEQLIALQNIEFDDRLNCDDLDSLEHSLNATIVRPQGCFQ